MQKKNVFQASSVKSDTSNDLFDHTVVPTLLVASDLTIRRSNRAMSKLLGFSVAEITGSKLTDFACKPDAVLADTLQTLWKNRHSFFCFETSLMTKAREALSVGFTAIYVEVAGEELAYTIVEELTHKWEYKESHLIPISSPVETNNVVEKQQMRIKELEAQVADLKKFEFMAEHTNDALILVRKDGSFAYLNKKAKEVWGYSDEELPALRVADIDPLHSDERLSKIFENAYNGTEFSLDTVNRHKNGSLFPVEARIAALVLNNEQYIMVVNRDVSERKRAQDALAKSEAKFRGVLEHFPVAIALLEGEDLVVSVANKGILEIWGKEKDAVMGKPIVEALPEMKGQPYPDFLRQVLRTGEPFYGRESEVHLFRNNSMETGYFDFINYPFKNQEGIPESIIVVANEITAQVTARRMIEASEARLQTIIDTMAEGLGITDAEGNPVYVNQMAKKILGVELAEIKNLEWSTLGPGGEPLPGAEHPLAVVRKTGKPIHGAEVVIKVPGGKTKYLSINGSPLLDENGRMKGVVSIFTDISERKDLLRQKDEFISTVSHELKTPVTSLKAYIQVLKLSFSDSKNDQSRDFLDRMDKLISRLQTLISDLLDVTRLESNKLVFKKETVKLNVLLTEVVSELQLTSPGHHLLITQNTAILVNIDKNRIIQVIVNLITNAIKYSPGADRINIQLYLHADMVVCSVEDFGIGIPPEHRDRVFERFHQVGGQSHTGGFNLGLGLYISKEIIKKAGGDLWFESEEGKGTIFYFSLPCC